MSNKKPRIGFEEHSEEDAGSSVPILLPKVSEYCSGISQSHGGHGQQCIDAASQCLRQDLGVLQCLRFFLSYHRRRPRQSRPANPLSKCSFFCCVCVCVCMCARTCVCVCCRLECNGSWFALGPATLWHDLYVFYLLSMKSKSSVSACEILCHGFLCENACV